MGVRLFGFRFALAAAAFLSLLCAVPQFAAAQTGASSELDGRVLDAQTALPLSGASVQVLGQALATTTDAAGTFRLEHLQPGSYRVRISRSGYQPGVWGDVMLAAGQSTRLPFRCNPPQPAPISSSSAARP